VATGKIAGVAHAWFDQISETQPCLPRSVRALILKQLVTPGEAP